MISFGVYCVRRSTILTARFFFFSDATGVGDRGEKGGENAGCFLDCRKIGEKGKGGKRSAHSNGGHVIRRTMTLTEQSLC